jgi:hypothetical protein
MSGNNNHVCPGKVITEFPAPPDLWNKIQLIRIIFLVNSKHYLKEKMPWIEEIS